MNRRNATFALFTVVWTLIDQATKAWVVSTLEYRVDRVQIIPGFLDFVHAQNPGAAFGFLGDFPLRFPLFMVFTAAAAWVIYDMLRKLPEDDRYMSTALGLIASGALGNLIDRLRQQYVTDFIRVYTESPGIVGFLRGLGLPAEWPTFNVADATLVVGVGMLIVHYLWFDESRKQKTEPAAPEERESDEPASKLQEEA